MKTAIGNLRLAVWLMLATNMGWAEVRSGGPYSIVSESTSWSLAAGPVASPHSLALVVLGQPSPVGMATGSATVIASGFLGSRPVLDTDDDGIPDDEDDDVDGDSIANAADTWAYDTDNDGLHNFADRDDDGDLLDDLEELGWGTKPLVADTDHDGFDDGTEVRMLRTSPTDPQDNLQVGHISVSFESIVVTWPTKLSVLYYVQRLASLGSGLWEDVAGPYVGTGGWLSFTNAASGPVHFYRVRVGP